VSRVARIWLRSSCLAVIVSTFAPIFATLAGMADKKQTVIHAVVPSAGRGTRFLPITKSVPKEMLPVVDRPSIEYIVREATDAGIEDVLFVTRAGKQSIEDYFDAEPGLVGVSVGGAVGAVGAIVLGYDQQPLVLAGAAFVGSLLATLAAWLLGRRAPGAAGILLAGIAINAFGGALIGVFTYLANDMQLRSLTFWNLGSLATADWAMLSWLAPWTLVLMGALLWQWRALNALLLGEREALHLGFELQRLRARLILLVTLLVGPLVAVTGIIGFVGLVVPHLVRLVVGADHRPLLPLSLLAGALILVLADWVARIVVIPAELPIGIVTSLLGAPVLFMLIQREAR